jgi:hypothetical protein
MKQFWNITRCLFLALMVAGCASSGDWANAEPMTDREIQRYRNEFYLKMTPAQRNHYESLPTRATRDAYLRQLGALKTKKRKRR